MNKMKLPKINYRIFRVQKGESYRMPVSIAGDERGGFSSNAVAPHDGIVIMIKGYGILITDQELVDVLMNPAPACTMFMGKPVDYWLKLEEQAILEGKV